MSEAERSAIPQPLKIQNKMGLKRFNTETTKGMGTGQPLVSIARNAGLISIFGATAEALGLKPGDKVSIVQDQDNPKDWYIDTKDEAGFKLRGSDKGKGLSFNNSVICNRLLDSLEFPKEHKRSSFTVSTKQAEGFDQEGLYAILTAKTMES